MVDVLAVAEENPPVDVVDTTVLDAVVDADIDEAGEDERDVEACPCPTVAASANKLELILQQFFSPQHQLLSPHFRTGALSPCHYPFAYIVSGLNSL